MAWHPMKPETIERRRREHAEQMAERKARLKANMKEKAERDGPGSFWADYYAESYPNESEALS